MHDAIINRLDEQAAQYKIHEHVDSRTFADAVDKLPFPPERMLKTIAFRLKSGGWILQRQWDSVQSLNCIFVQYAVNLYT